jgi:hypothetical protein
MKIWIVEFEAIEEHMNLAVCTSLENAEKFLAKCKAGEYEQYTIQEYETDVWCWNPNSHASKPSTEPEVKPIEVAST